MPPAVRNVIVVVVVAIVLVAAYAFLMRAKTPAPAPAPKAAAVAPAPAAAQPSPEPAAPPQAYGDAPFSPRRPLGSEPPPPASITHATTRGPRISLLLRP